MQGVRRALIAIAAALVLAGCGNDRTDPPEVGRIAPPGAFEDSRFARAGIFLRTPSAWSIERSDAPFQVVSIRSGSAQIGVWRYPRSEPLPETEAQLGSARDELVAEIKSKRDPDFTVQSTRVVIKPGIRAVEIVGIGTNQGEKRKVRSLHAYGHDGEVVVDAYAPPGRFDRVDEQTFGPLTRSLKLSAPP